MPYEFLVWLLCVLLSGAALGINMHITMQFTDLENDIVNPHDAAASVNSAARWKYGSEGLLAILLVVHGYWWGALVPILIAAYDLRQWQTKRHIVDVTEIYRQIKPRRNKALIELVMALVSFIIMLYRFLWVMLHQVLSPTGKDAARQVLQEAAASMF